MLEITTDKLDLYSKMSLCSSAVLDICHMIYRLAAICCKERMKQQKNTQKGKKDQGLCGRKTRTDEQNGPYVSGRVEEYMRQGRRHSDGVF